MRKFTLTMSLFGTMLALCFWSGPAHAQATRTWVSGVGDDANPCSRTAPCKTFAGAISKTAANGEIDALDPGGYGAVTITKAITIDGGGGQVASVRDHNRRRRRAGRQRPGIWHQCHRGSGWTQ
jgi:hypothetical protein